MKVHVQVQVAGHVQVQVQRVLAMELAGVMVDRVVVVKEVLVDRTAKALKVIGSNE